MLADGQTLAVPLEYLERSRLPGVPVPVSAQVSKPVGPSVQRQQPAAAKDAPGAVPMAQAGSDLASAYTTEVHNGVAAAPPAEQRWCAHSSPQCELSLVTV